VTILENQWIPERIKDGVTPKQVEFLCYEGREGLYGGAAGGGKSVALLIAALQYIDEPGYSALILRRTFKQLSKSDSILAKAKEWLLPLKKQGIRYNDSDHKFTFPGGQTLEFGHMDHENAIYDYQGGAWSYVGVDEATQFTPAMISYPRTRQRRPAGSAMPLRWRGASNPGGVGHDYIKERYIKAKDGSDPSTLHRQFFRATIEDNPNLDREEYVTQLRESGVDPLTLEQLLAGNWDAIASGRFKRSWLRYYTKRGDWYVITEGKIYMPDQLKNRFLTVDPAATVKKTAKDDPDWTAISAWAMTPCGLCLWLGCERYRCEIPDIPNYVAPMYARHRAGKVLIEGFGIGRGPAQVCQRHPSHMNVIEYTPNGKDKLTNATNAMNLAEAGRLWLPADDRMFPLSDVESELLRFTGDEKKDGHDDIVDTLSAAANLIAGDVLDKNSGAVPFVIPTRRY
jgi:phage terminase large subunit-like protein